MSKCPDYGFFPGRASPAVILASSQAWDRATQTLKDYLIYALRDCILPGLRAAFYLFICLNCVCVCVCVCVLGLYPWHMEVPRLGVELELELPACTTGIAMQDPSCVCNLQHSSRQHPPPAGGQGSNPRPHGYALHSFLLWHNGNSPTHPLFGWLFNAHDHMSSF